jgi:hypothetical protein
VDSIRKFFTHPATPAQRLYEALRAYFVDRLPAQKVAARFGYQPATLYVQASRLRAGQMEPFFVHHRPGPRHQPKKDPVRSLAIELRKKNHSIYDIHRLLAARGQVISVRAIWEILSQAGFARLPRRLDEERPAEPQPLATAKADRRAFGLTPTHFPTAAGGLFLFLPLLAQLQIGQLVRRAGYPGTPAIPPLQYFLALLSLKLLSRERISHVMDVAHDRGVGLFCGLNVVPKTTALTTYSYRVNRQQNRTFLKLWNQALLRTGLIEGGSFNLDFHAIAHFGEEAVLEKNYVPRRSQAEKSVLTFLAQDGARSVLCYSQAGVLQRQQADQVLEFARFWKQTSGRFPRELIFDSKLTTYPKLSQLNEMGIHFTTLRRKSPTLIRQLMTLPTTAWTPCPLDVPGRKYKNPKIVEQTIRLKGYAAPLRQIAAKDLGRELPTLLITNNWKPTPAQLLGRYAKRMIIENAIADGVHFFHLDALCSSLHVEVDFSVVLTIVANGLYRMLARPIQGFEHVTAKKLHRKFTNTAAVVRVLNPTQIEVLLSLRAHNPLLKEAGLIDRPVQIPWLNHATVTIKIPTDTQKP